MFGYFNVAKSPPIYSLLGSSLRVLYWQFKGLNKLEHGHVALKALGLHQLGYNSLKTYPNSLFFWLEKGKLCPKSKIEANLI